MSPNHPYFTEDGGTIWRRERGQLQGEWGAQTTLIVWKCWAVTPLDAWIRPLDRMYDMAAGGPNQPWHEWPPTPRLIRATKDQGWENWSGGVLILDNCYHLPLPQIIGLSASFTGHLKSMKFGCDIFRFLVMIVFSDTHKSVVAPNENLSHKVSLN